MRRRRSITEAEAELRRDLALAIVAGREARGIGKSALGRHVGFSPDYIRKIEATATRAERGVTLRSFVACAEFLGVLADGLRSRVAAVEEERAAFARSAAEKASRALQERRERRGARVAEASAVPEVQPDDVWPSDLQLVRISDGVILHVRDPDAAILPQIDSGALRPFADKDRRAVLMMRRISEAARSIVVIDPEFDPDEPRWLGGRIDRTDYRKKLAWHHKPGGRAPGAASLGAHVRSMGRVR